MADETDRNQKFDSKSLARELAEIQLRNYGCGISVTLIEVFDELSRSRYALLRFLHFFLCLDRLCTIDRCNEMSDFGFRDSYQLANVLNREHRLLQ